MTEREIGLDRYGTAGGPLVIALHGAVANGKTWLPLARVLAPGLELWCPDLPGHGARRSEPFRLSAAVESVVTLIGAAGVRRVVLAGDSLGGYIALAAAACKPARLVGVVAGGCTWSMTGLGEKLARASDLPPRLVAGLLGEARLERFAASQLSRVTDAETAAAIAARGLRVRSRSESLGELAGLDLIPLVRAIHVPIAFINGAWDWPTRAGEKSLVHAAETATCTIVPRKGHGVGFFAPAAFARVIETLAVGSCAADT